MWASFAIVTTLAILQVSEIQAKDKQPICFEASLYHFVKDELMNYDNAMEYCNQRGMDLLSINSQSESEFLRGHYQGITWTSGKRVGNSNNWKWMSSIKINSPWPAHSADDGIWRNWVAGEPNARPGVEDCIEVKPHEEGKWNDRTCQFENNVICEAITKDVCPRPSGWCNPSNMNVSPHATFLLIDCDGDGIPDPTCSALNGNFWIISSANNCKYYGPKYRCRVSLTT